MIASRNAIYLIQNFEGLRLNCYKDLAGHSTVGIGHKNIFLKDKAPISWETALTFFEIDLEIAEQGLNHLIDASSAAGILLRQSEFDALLSFVFNLGIVPLAESTLWKHIDEGELAAAADAFLDWDKAHVNGELVAVDGLKKRRQAERALFLGEDFRPFL